MVNQGGHSSVHLFCSSDEKDAGFKGYRSISTVERVLHPLMTMATRRCTLWVFITVFFGLLSTGCSAPMHEEEHVGCGLDFENAESIASTSQALSSLSCKMSATTGYKRGTAFKIRTVVVDGKKVEWKTANAYMKMAKAAAKAGVHLRVVSGFRSMAEQKYLYNCYRTGSCNGGNLAAVPGYSNHQSGHALDLNTSSAGVYSWLTKNASRFGFRRTVPSEAWHWEWWGKDRGTGPCNPRTLKASLYKIWSNAPKAKGNWVDYELCAGRSYRFSMTFQNRGSAVWRDVPGRGHKVGSDVFLVALNGWKDKLSGKKRVSLKYATNSRVVAGPKGKACMTKNGCRRTRFTRRGLKIRAPKKSGIYTSSWRLRDYSGVWRGSRAFGPKVKVRFRVRQCFKILSGDPPAGSVPGAKPETLGAEVIDSDEPDTESLQTPESDSEPTESSPTSEFDSEPGQFESEEQGFDDGGFNGVAEDEADSVVYGEACSAAPPGSAGTKVPWWLVAMVFIGLVFGRRSYRRRLAGPLLAIAAGIALLACGPSEEGEDASVRAQLGGTSPLVEYFREAEQTSQVPAELLATISWLQARLSMNASPTHPGHHGAAPREWGVMALGAGGLVTVEKAASAGSFEVEDVKTLPRINVKAAAALLRQLADQRGIDSEAIEDWAPALEAYGGVEFTRETLRLAAKGFEGTDDEGLSVWVKPPRRGGELTATVHQELGFPGGNWSPASSSNYTNASRGSAQIKYVVIHTTQGSYSGTLSWFKNPAAKVSAHYVVRSSDGKVTQMVDDRDVAWHDACFNQNSIGIEHEGYVSQPSKWYTPQLYAKSARLTSWLCDKYGIPKTRKYIMGHGDTPDCSHHYDPGPGWNWSKYMNLVKAGGKIPTLKAKLSQKWSDAKPHPSKKIDVQVCQDQKFKFTFSFKNTGTAVWRDVKKRGSKVGSDVFLVTTSGKPDKLTRRTRYSLNRNANSVVVPTPKGRPCNYKAGCIRTRFIKKGMVARAPKALGVYRSRWRLRDYSKFWGAKSKPFGPIAELSVKVVACSGTSQPPSTPSPTSAPAPTPTPTSTGSSPAAPTPTSTGSTPAKTSSGGWLDADSASLWTKTEDVDFHDDGFRGDEEELDDVVGGCSLAPAVRGTRSAHGLLLSLLGLAWLVRRFHRRDNEPSDGAHRH